MSARPVPVPPSCSALYVVLTPEPLPPEDHLEMPTEQLLRRNGTSEAALERLRRAPHQHALTCEAPPSAIADVMRETRVEALQLAEAHDGIVVDLIPPRVLEHRSHEVSLAHAAQWFVLDYYRIADGVLATDGLDRFGLPEVRCGGVEQASHAMYGAVLTGLAHRLIAEWPTNDPVGRATVTLRDIAYGLGDASAASTPTDRQIEIDITYDVGDHVLDVALLGHPADALFAI